MRIGNFILKRGADSNPLYAEKDLLKPGGVTYLEQGEGVSFQNAFNGYRTEYPTSLTHQFVTCDKCVTSFVARKSYAENNLVRICPKCLRLERRKNKIIKPLSESYAKRKIKDF